MQKLLNLVLSGAVTGAIYSIMASGLVLTYQTSGLFNFAHGAVAFTTAFVYYQLHVGQGIPIVPALVISVLLFAPLLGLALDRMLLRRLATAPVYARIVGTIGLLVALPALAIWLVESLGNTVLGFDLPRVSDVQSIGGSAPGIGPAPPEVLHITSGVTLDTDQVAVFIAAAVAALLLWVVIRRTRVGLEMRAVVDRESLASLRGVNPARASSVAWVLTMVLAGLGGVLIAPLFQLNDIIFTLVVFGSLAAVAVSGLRSIPIAFAGGLALGVIQNLVAGYGDDFLPGFLNGLAGFRSSIPFILTFAILCFVGRERGREGGTAAEDVPPADHRAGLPAWRRRLPWAIFTVALLAFALQWIHVDWLQADTYEAGLIASGLAVGIIFLSFVVVTGLGGMVSLAQATFVTAGGFIAGWALERDWGIDFPLVASNGKLNFMWGLVLAALGAAVVGALVAIPVRRLGAVSVALGTFAIAFVADLVPFGVFSISHGTTGWSIPPFTRSAASLDLPVINTIVDWVTPGSFDHLDLFEPQHQVLAIAVLFGVLALSLHALQRSASGRAMLAVRSSDVAARTIGISPARAKILIFALSAAIAGFGGALYGMVRFQMTNTTAPPLIGLIWLAVAVTFGVRRPGGALLAGLAFACSPQIFQWLGDDVFSGAFADLTTSVQFTPILFGLGAINLAKNPDGLLALVGHQRLERRLQRERKARIAEAEAALTASDGGGDEQAPAVPPATPAGPVAPTVSPAPADGGATETAALTIEHVVAGYGDVEVLHGVDLAVPPGRVVALLGANGAGKSTLCSVASGLLGVTSGRVLVGGRDVTKSPPHERARHGVLLVPEARGIFPGLTVEENLQVLLRDAAQRQTAYDRFPILGERRKQVAGLLSGGEQQMLSLAPALADPPDVFIADEPTLGLAPLAAEVVLAAIREIRDGGAAVLLVEEKAREVMQLADTVAFMDLGRIVWIGPRDEADAERIAATYLGVSLG